MITLKEQEYRNSRRCAIYGTKGSFGSPQFEKNVEQLKKTIDTLINKGITTFVTASNDGYELNAALYIVEQKIENPAIKLVIVRPYEGKDSYWRTKALQRSVEQAADMVKVISESADRYHPRTLDSWILDHCNTIICISDTTNSKLHRLSKVDPKEKNIIYIPHRTVPEKNEIRSVEILFPMNLIHELFPKDSEQYLILSDYDEEQIIRILEDTLKEKELYVLESRFIDNMTLQKIGEVLSISKERVRQIQDKALRKLKYTFNKGYTGDKQPDGFGANELVIDNERLNPKEIVIAANQIPGHASFNNFQEVKEYLRNGLSVYNNTVYSIDNIDQAKEDFLVLKEVKTKLTKKRNELRKAYTQPIEVVIDQIDELIEMVKVPYGVIDRMLKSNAKDIKRREIMLYAQSKASVLGEYADKVINSPAFYNPRWENVSYREKVWKKDIDGIIQNAKETIDYIVSKGEKNTGLLLGFFFDKLSLDGADEFVDTVHNTKSESSNEVTYIDMTTGELIQSLDVGNQSIENELKTDISESITPIEKKVLLRGDALKIDRYLAMATFYDIYFEVL